MQIKSYNQKNIPHDVSAYKVNALHHSPSERNIPSAYPLYSRFAQLNLFRNSLD